MKKIKTILGLTALAILSIISFQSYADVWRVNNNAAYNDWTNHQVFDNLTLAVNTSSPGDTLYIESSGINYGTLTISKQLTIIGTGYFLNQNTGKQNNSQTSSILDLVFDNNSSGSYVSGLEVVGNGYFGDFVLNNITIDRCYFPHSFTGAGIIFTNFTNTLTNIVITKNFIESNILPLSGAIAGQVANLIVTNNRVGGAIVFISSCTGTIAQNAIGSGFNIDSGIDFYNNIVVNGPVIQNTNSSTNIFNNVFSFSQSALPWLVGGNNNFGVPYATIFDVTTIPTTDGILKLNPIGTCPQCYQGFPSGTVEVGVYGGNEPYILSGIPNIPTIYNLQAPADAPQGGNLPVNVSTRSNN